MVPSKAEQKLFFNLFQAESNKIMAQDLFLIKARLFLRIPKISKYINNCVRIQEHRVQVDTRKHRGSIEENEERGETSRNSKCAYNSLYVLRKPC